MKTAVPTNLNVTDIMRYLRIDKKNTTTGLRLIMIKSIGGVASPFLHVVDDTLVEVALSSLIEVKPKEGPVFLRRLKVILLFPRTCCPFLTFTAVYLRII
jgi:hypothetical protein